MTLIKKLNIRQKSIQRIFNEEGESYFRDIEEEICKRLLTKNNCVISLGGGSIINKKIRKLIKQNSYSIYLQVKLKVLVDRLKYSKQRPLLNKNTKNIEILKQLYENRKIFYEKADFIVNNNNDKNLVLEKFNLNSNYMQNKYLIKNNKLKTKILIKKNYILIL